VRERAVVAFSRLVAEFVATAAAFDPSLAQAETQAKTKDAALVKGAHAQAQADVRAHCDLPSGPCQDLWPQEIDNMWL
jgi:hypothetical protein